MKERFTTGQMAKICNISTKTLRHYEQLQLLQPDKVDSHTGYRYYNNASILKLNIIKQLKTLGFTLKEIKKLLSKRAIKQSLKVYKTKEEQIDLQIAELQATKKCLAQSVDNIETFSQQQKEFIDICPLPERTVCYTRYHSPCSPDGFIARFNELLQLIETYAVQTTSPLITVLHDHYTQFNYDHADIEVCREIKPSGKLPKKYKRTLPAGIYLSAIHLGSYKDMIHTYKKIVTWTEQHHYRLIGPAIEIYIVDASIIQTPSQFVTEIQFQVEKTNSS